MVYRWLLKNEAFREIYGRARQEQIQLLADQILPIADTPVIGIKTKTDARGTEVTEGDMIEHRKLQIDTRKWLLSKLAPAKYGDRQIITGADGKSAPTLEVVVRSVIEESK